MKVFLILKFWFSLKNSVYILRVNLINGIQKKKSSRAAIFSYSQLSSSVLYYKSFNLSPPFLPVLGRFSLFFLIYSEKSTIFVLASLPTICPVKTFRPVALPFNQQSYGPIKFFVYLTLETPSPSKDTRMIIFSDSPGSRLLNEEKISLPSSIANFSMLKPFCLEERISGA